MNASAPLFYRRRIGPVHILVAGIETFFTESFQWRSRLSGWELRHAEMLHGSSHRRLWLAGRLAGKFLLADVFPRFRADISRLSIVSRNEQGKGMRPRLRVEPQEAVSPPPPQLIACGFSFSSINHLIAVAVSVDPRIRPGIDLTPTDPLPPSFAATWFSSEERVSLDASTENYSAIAEGWAVKEAAYKAIHDGEPFLPRRIEVYRKNAAFYRVHYLAGAVPRKAVASIRHWGGHVCALVGYPVPPARSVLSSRRGMTVPEACSSPEPTP